jgi:hypothetical protein
MSRFSAHVSIGGALLAPPDGQLPLGMPHRMIGGYTLSTASQPRPIQHELVMEGETNQPLMRMFSSRDSNRYAIYTPGRAEFRDISGRLIEAQDDPLAAMQSSATLPSLGPLERVFLCGALVWSAIVGPFVIELGGKSEEEPASRARSGFRQLRIESPRSLDPLAPIRRFFIDDLGRAQRSDYELRPLFGGPATDTLSAYGIFDGIALPTLRRLQARSPDGTIEATPLIDIEIFDVRFL